MPVKRTRPQALPGVTYQMQTGACGKIYVTITQDDACMPFEVFVRFGKAGHCGAAIFDGMTKLISYGLRSGMNPADAVKALSGVICTHGRRTCLNAVAEALDDALGSPAGIEAETEGDSGGD